jgi:selenocysteine lyase/cysteine desulfurase
MDGAARQKASTIAAGGDLSEMDYRKEFAEFDDVTYLDAANQGPLPIASAKAAKDAIEWKKLPQHMPDGIYFDLPNRIRASIAQLIHADAEDIAITTGASAGFCAVAAGIDWKAGDEVLVARGEFPAHFSTWLPYQHAGKLTTKVIAPRDRFISADDYIANITAKTRLVSASLVRFDNGVRLDAPRIAEACRKVGALFLLDASQAAGIVPIDAKAMGADFITSSGYKWLLGPYGTGFFWARREWSDKQPLGPVYWMALEGASKFSGLPAGELRLAPGARRWDSAETGNFINLSALDASLKLIVSVGSEKLFAQAQGLCRMLIERLPMDRCVLVSPQEDERRGQYVCIAGRTPEKTLELHAKLRAEKVIVCLREGAMRVSPYLYNTERDIARLISVLSV